MAAAVQALATAEVTATLVWAMPPIFVAAAVLDSVAAAMFVAVVGVVVAAAAVVAAVAAMWAIAAVWAWAMEWTQKATMKMYKCPNHATHST